MNKGWKFVFFLGVVALLLALLGACANDARVVSGETDDTHWTQLASRGLYERGLYRHYDGEYGVVCYLSIQADDVLSCIAVGE